MSRILIVNEVEALRELTCITFCLHGYTTLEAANATDAIRVALEEKPDLILIDLGNPDSEGLAALSMIRRTIGLYLVPVVIISNERHVPGAVCVTNVDANAYVMRASPSSSILFELVRAILLDRRDKTPAWSDAQYNCVMDRRAIMQSWRRHSLQA